MSSIVAWASGASAAPNVPWIMRNATICPSVWAAPHIIEAKVKPAVQMTNTFLRPKTWVPQPSGDVMIAEATM